MGIRDQLYHLRRSLRDAVKYGPGYARRMWHFRTRYMTTDPRMVERIHDDKGLPICVEIEVTTHCNLKCRICEHTYWSEKSQHMPMERFEAIVEQFPSLYWIGLTGIGESFLHPRFQDMIRLVKGRGAFLELYDTFYFIDEAQARFLIESPCDRLLISLDGASAQTYESLRVNSDFERVTGNLRRFFRLKRELGAEKPELEFHFIVNRDNRHEIGAFVELARDLSGGDGTQVVFTRLLHPYPEVAELFTEIGEEDRAAALEAGRRCGVRVAWNADAVTHKPPCSMCSAWMMPFIFVTGEVIPCCSGNEANNRAFQKETSMGNIFEQSLEEIWNGPKYRQLRETLRAGRFPPSCTNCCLYAEGSHRC